MVDSDDVLDSDDEDSKNHTLKEVHETVFGAEENSALPFETCSKEVLG